jgi:hypothetical protein
MPDNKLLWRLIMKIFTYFFALIACFTQTIDAAIIQAELGENSSSIMPVGEAFSVEISGLEFPESQGGGFNLSYDPSVLNVTDVAIDDLNTWTFVNDSGSIDNVNGELNDVLVSDFPGVSGDFNVATISFLTVGAGTSALALTESLINPWASDGVAIHPTQVSDALVQVQVVPVPAAFWLLASGLIGLLSVAKRKSI